MVWKDQDHTAALRRTVHPLIAQQELRVATTGRGTYEISSQVQRIVRESGIRAGLCHVFICHTSASLMLCENADPSVMQDLEAFRAGLSNTTTARDLGVVMRTVAESDRFTEASRSEMIAILERQHFRENIPAGLPAGTRVANKTGWITGINHDAAIEYASQRRLRIRHGAQCPLPPGGGVLAGRGAPCYVSALPGSRAPR